MQPPAALLKRGIHALPTMGDGRQSGTSGTPSILNISPEAAVGGGLALLKTGDRIRIDLNTRKVDVLLPEGELEARRAAWNPPELQNKTPWEEIYRSMVGQLGTAPAWNRRRCTWTSSRPAAKPEQPLMTTGHRLAGKTAFVTAAAQGIGRATALAFAARARGHRHR